MEHRRNSVYEDESMDYSRMIITHHPHLPNLSHWLDVRVFYVRFSNFEIDESTPEHLTLNHIPLTIDTVLEVNGRSTVCTECVSCLLKKDRVDKKSEEATFVNTDTVRMSRNTRFEVYDKDIILLSGVLELCNDNGVVEESENHSRKWSMKCEPLVLYRSSVMPSPTIEVYVTGFCSGMPIILTKTLHIDSIPKHGITKSISEESAEFDLQVLNDCDFKENGVDVDYNSMLFTTEYFEEDDQELSWFNAGLRLACVARGSEDSGSGAISEVECPLATCFIFSFNPQKLAILTSSFSINRENSSWSYCRIQEIFDDLQRQNKTQKQPS